MNKDRVYEIYNFVKDYLNGKFGITPIEDCIEKHLPKEKVWKDATKELPKDGERVLVSGTELEIKMVEPYIGLCVQGFWWSKDGDALKVDYWMPLPELPEKEESK